MLQATYSFEDLKMSSRLIRDLISNSKEVKPLVDQFFDLDNIPKQIEKKKLSRINRGVLVDALKRQNALLDLDTKANKNIESLLKDSTYTITTGHQLNLLTGPLYSIYKIAQCIVLTNDLNTRYPDNSFVPVFWMATEDHDFEEINHLHLFGQKMSWEKEGQEDVVAGRIKPEDIEDFLKQIEDKFQDPKALEVIRVFTGFYRESENLSVATRKLVHHLFKDTGLLIIDGDDRELKKLFKEVMIREVKEGVGHTEVMKTNEYLTENDYHEQVYVRESNLFYIDESGVRQRIRKEQGDFFIEAKPIERNQLIAEITDHPERFSPNALYRPLYQEQILPNLAYIGGGGEIAYWLQIKALFEAHNITFPMLRVRDSVLLYSKDQAQLLENLRLELLDIKLGVHDIVKEIAMNESDADLQLTAAEADLLKAKSKVVEKVHKVNPALETMVEAEFTKMIKSIEKIEAKLIKAEKAKHEKTQKQLTRLRDKFFPDNGFQERHDNFLPFYLKDDQFVHKILSNLKPENSPLIRTIEI